MRTWLGLLWNALHKLRRRCDGPRWRPTLKMGWFALTHPRATGHWLRYLNAPAMAALAESHPRLFDKVQRPYMNRRLRPYARVRTLVSHYDWLQCTFTDETIDRLYSRQPVVLAQFAANGPGEDLALCLGYGEDYEREGELTLSLRRRTPEAVHGHLVAALVFSFTLASGVRLLRISCVMGCGDALNAAHIKEATKMLHGLRPKVLLVRMAQGLATRWRTELRGIDPSDHPFAGLRYRFSRRKRYAIRHMLQSYGALWSECGGKPVHGGWHALPTVPHDKPLVDVPSRKRSQYVRRHALLDDIAQQLDESFARLQRQGSCSADATPL